MAAGDRDDAEGAAVATTILYFEVGTRLPTVRGIRPPAAFRHGQLGVSKSVVHIKGGHSRRSGLQRGQRDKARGQAGNLRHQRLMAVADHSVHAGQRSSSWGARCA